MLLAYYINAHICYTHTSNSTHNKYIVKPTQGIVVIQGMIIVTWCQEHKIGVRMLQVKKVKKYVIQKEKMTEQVITSEAIAKAVAEATRIMIPTVAEMQVQDQKVNEDSN